MFFKSKSSNEYKFESNIFALNKDSLELFICGKLNPYDSKLFVKSKSNKQKKIYLLEEVSIQFNKMEVCAKKDDINLTIISGYRSFEYQKNIWNQKYIFAKNHLNNDDEIFNYILKYTAIPGTSRHHWGTEIDINSVENSYFETKEGKKIYKWLTLNANKFGFCQVYNKNEFSKNRYLEEKWHWSYIKLAQQFHNYYNIDMKFKKITGFMGDYYFSQKNNIVQEYVNGINIDCCQ